MVKIATRDAIIQEHFPENETVGSSNISAISGNNELTQQLERSLILACPVSLEPQYPDRVSHEKRAC